MMILETVGIDKNIVWWWCDGQLLQVRGRGLENSCVWPQHVQTGCLYAIAFAFWLFISVYKLPFANNIRYKLQLWLYCINNKQLAELCKSLNLCAVIPIVITLAWVYLTLAKLYLNTKHIYVFIFYLEYSIGYSFRSVWLQSMIFGFRMCSHM